MTKVTYLHGIPANEYADRGKEMPQRRYLNYGDMTVGETRLALAAEQARLLAAFYPEDKQFARGADELENILRSGLHRGLHLPIAAPAFVRRAIAQAKGKTAPEGGFMLSAMRGIGQPSSPLVPYDDCDALMTATWNPYTSQGEDEYTYTDNETSMACRARNNEIGILNRHLEPSAHHLLYNYIAKPNEMPTVVATKSVNHRIAVSSIAQLFNFNEENLNLWLRNGVMRNNAREGASPLQPETTIQYYSLVNHEGMPSVGIDPATVAAAVKAIQGIVAAIIAAIGSTMALLAALKRERENEIRNVARGIGAGTFGPEKTDWPKDFTAPEGSLETPQQSVQLPALPLMLGAGAAIFLLTRKN